MFGNPMINEVGVHHRFLVANRHLAVIANPAHTRVGAGYSSFPAGNAGHDIGELYFITDALEVTTYDNGQGLVIYPYLLRQDNSIKVENTVIHASAHHFLPDTHTFTGFQLAGTVNPNQDYKITLHGSSVHHNFTPIDQRMPVHAVVTTGTGASWTVGTLTALLVYRLIYDLKAKTYPNAAVAPYYEVLMATAGEYSTLSTAIINYKNTPTTANYNAVLTAWNTIKTAFDTAFSTFLANPTLPNANILGTARPVVIVKSKWYNDVVTIGFSGYFDDVSNTVTVTQFLPLEPAVPTNLLKGHFGVGTKRSGNIYHQSQTDQAPFSESFPYNKVLDGNEYGVINFKYEQRQHSSGLAQANKTVMFMTIFIKQNGTGTNYHFDNGTGAPVTGTVVSNTSFNAMLNNFQAEFPYIVF
ncbi:MAG: hypothetical protein RML94_00140 [Bacteroidia bacterium]|nr:hypothetical protein [Bacteroidia bacterium]